MQLACGPNVGYRLSKLIEVFFVVVAYLEELEQCCKDGEYRGRGSQRAVGRIRTICVPGSAVVTPGPHRHRGHQSSILAIASLAHIIKQFIYIYFNGYALTKNKSIPYKYAR